MREATRQELLKQLEELERALLQAEKRSSKAFMESVLHPEFREFGRSGRVYSRQEIIDEFHSVSEFPMVCASNFELKILAKDVWLLTYLTAHLGENNQQSRRTLRSSLWLASQNGPQLLFHQGTAID